MKKIWMCLVLGMMWVYGGTIDDGLKHYDKKEFKEASKLFKKACENNISEGCFKLGYMYENNQSVGLDNKRAFELYVQSCDLGHKKACFKVGTCYDRGGVYKVKLDSKKAEKYYAKACDGGHYTACYHLAEMYQFSYYPKENRDKMIKLYEKSCNHSEGLGCYKLGNIYGEDHKKESMYWYKKGCDQEDEQSCFRLGDINIKDIATINPETFKALIKEYKDKCSKGEDTSCYRAAVFYATGRGVRQSYKKANKFFYRACGLGDKLSCMEYLMLQESGY